MIIKKNGMTCHSNFWLLPKNFLAITLFGHIFFRLNNNEMKWHLDSYSGNITLNHEHIHVLQAKTFKTKYLGFYSYYVWYWIVNLFRYGVKGQIAYKNIPFEREAFQQENNFTYSASNWKSYTDKHLQRL